MSENKTSKYIKYALGEILLVMIGILLALQVNNWNQGKELKKLEKSYLIGILNDLKSDTTFINNEFTTNFQEHKKNHLFLDSLVKKDLMIQESQLDMVWHPVVISKSGQALYPTVGTYDAMISEGKSGLIEDRKLFSAIQELYEIWYSMNTEFRLRRDKIADEIRLKYTYNFQFDPVLDLLQNKSFLADMRFIYEYKKNYAEFIDNRLIPNLVEVISKIENNLAEN